MNAPPTELTTDHIEPVMAEVGHQLDLLDVFGGKYARQYLGSELGVEKRPFAPAGMHPRIAHALRDIAKDEAVAIRHFGPGGSRHRPVREPAGDAA